MSAPVTTRAGRIAPAIAHNNRSGRAWNEPKWARYASFTTVLDTCNGDCQTISAAVTAHIALNGIIQNPVRICSLLAREPPLQTNRIDRHGIHNIAPVSVSVISSSAPAPL